jgi:hypothetical protein
MIGKPLLYLKERIGGPVKVFDLKLIKRQSSSLVNWHGIVSRTIVGLSHHNLIHMK